jgi:hypothetical protein
VPPQPTLTPQTPPEEAVRLVRDLPPGAHPPGWHRWDNVQEAHRRLADELVAGLGPAPPPGDGRGVVTAGGGPHLFPSLWVLVHALREVGCALPVQAWYKGDQEMDPGMKRLLAPLGVSFVDAHRFAQHFPCRILNGWELKPYAVLHCPFREVLFLDADAAPLRDPSDLFDAEPFRSAGAVLWPDYPTWNLREDVWRTFGIPLPDGWAAPVAPARVGESFGRPIPDGYEAAVESGQLLVDRGRCWRELRLALWLCERSDFSFYHFHGDKEAFHLAWRKLGTPYARPAFWPGWDTHTMIQFDFDGRPLVAHRNLDKWLLDGSNRRTGTAPGEERGFRLVEQLRSRWGGVPWRNDHPTAVEAEVARALAGRFRYRRVGHDERDLELLPGGAVGAGAGGRERRWSVFLVEGEALLALCGDDRPTCVLRRCPDGVWRGHWLEYERMPVELAPAPPAGAGGPAAGDGLVLNLGCGLDVRPGVVNHDRERHSPGVDVAWDLNRTPWPWADGAAREVLATDVVEHLDDVVAFMDEAWRVLAPGGLLRLCVPDWRSAAAWTDPTHRRAFTARSFEYFTAEGFGRTYPFYTRRRWRQLEAREDPPGNLVFTLTPLKPAPAGAAEAP